MDSSHSIRLSLRDSEAIRRDLEGQRYRRGKTSSAACALYQVSYQLEMGTDESPGYLFLDPDGKAMEMNMDPAVQADLEGRLRPYLKKLPAPPSSKELVY